VIGDNRRIESVARHCRSRIEIQTPWPKNIPTRVATLIGHKMHNDMLKTAKISQKSTSLWRVEDLFPQIKPHKCGESAAAHGDACDRRPHHSG
jgi:hypothetical protein